MYYYSLRNGNYFEGESQLTLSQYISNKYVQCFLYFLDVKSILFVIYWFSLQMLRACIYKAYAIFTD